MTRLEWDGDDKHPNQTFGRLKEVWLFAITKRRDAMRGEYFNLISSLPSFPNDQGTYQTESAAKAKAEWLLDEFLKHTGLTPLAPH